MCVVWGTWTPNLDVHPLYALPSVRILLERVLSFHFNPVLVEKLVKQILQAECTTQRKTVFQETQKKCSS